MERTLFLACGFWLGGAGAWVVGAGYVLAPYVRGTAGPLADGLDRLAMREEGEEIGPPSAPAASDDDDAGAGAGVTVSPVRPVDASDLLTESQRRRLAPVNQLRRKRRSRKLRVIGADTDQKFVPLVAGARTSVEDSIMASYSAASLEVARERGEDYWVDPALLRREAAEQEAAVAAAELRRARFKRVSETQISEEKLRSEVCMHAHVALRHAGMAGPRRGLETPIPPHPAPCGRSSPRRTRTT